MADGQPATMKLDHLELSPGLVIEETARREDYATLFLLIALHLGRKVCCEFVEPAHVSDQWIFDILSREYYPWIMYRLTWGYYSLRIPEVAHLLKSQTRIIAHTAALGKKEDFLALFDGFLSKLGAAPPEHATEFERAIHTPPKRLASQAEIDCALATILEVACCFSGGLQDYREAIARKPCDNSRSFLPGEERASDKDRLGRWLLRGSGLGGCVGLVAGLLVFFFGLIDAQRWAEELLLFGFLGAALGGLIGALLASTERA